MSSYYDCRLPITLIGLVVLLTSPLTFAEDLTNQKTHDNSSVKFPISFDGVIMLDGSSYSGVYGDGESESEVHIRRANLGLNLEISPVVDVEASIKLEDGIDGAELKNMLVNWKINKQQNLSIGRQKEPFGLENTQSSKHIPAIERSMASSIFAPDRHTGLVYSLRDKRYSVALGVFETELEYDDGSEDNQLAVSARATGAVLKNSQQTVHLGASVTVRDNAGSSVKFKDEGEVSPAINIVSSKRYNVEQVQTLALEGAWLRGSLSMQSEYFQSEWELADGESAQDPSYSGAYIQAAWLLGGAQRRYNNGKFKLSGMKDLSASAWELMIRLSSVDLVNANEGVKAETVLAGVNYYKGKHIRVMAGILSAQTSGPDVSEDPDGNAATVRLQYAF